VSKAKAPSTKKLGDFLPIDMLLSAVSVLVVAQSISEIPEGLMNNPVYRGTTCSDVYGTKIIYATMLNFLEIKIYCNFKMEEALRKK
jgi:hypothetical protein